MDSPGLLAWQPAVTGDLAGLVVPWAGWPVAAGGMSGSLPGWPAAMACALRRPWAYFRHLLGGH